MALRVSTGLRRKLAAGLSAPSALLVGANLSFVANGAGVADQITDSSNRFITAGFKPGFYVSTFNATTAGNKGTFLVTAVTAGVLTLEADVLAASEAFPDTGCVVQSKGFSLAEMLSGGIIKGFSGNQPTSADKGATGSPLVVFSLNAGAFTAGSPDNGLIWEDGGDGIIQKPAGASWQGLGITDGTIGWFRIYDNAVTEGDSTSAIRIDGAVSLTGAQMNGSSVTTRTGATCSIDVGTLTIPTS